MPLLQAPVMVGAMELTPAAIVKEAESGSPLGMSFLSGMRKYGLPTKVGEDMQKPCL